jgi:dephospho-CoA kinase
MSHAPATEPDAHGAAGGGRGMLRRWVPEDEPIILTTRPSPLFILLRPIALLVVLSLLTILTEAIASRLGASRAALWAFRVGGCAIALLLAWQWLEWLSRLYVLTPRRIIAVAGVLRQGASDVPLTNVQNLLVQRSLLERLTGLGTLAVATPGTCGYEVVWLMVERPDEVLSTVRCAIDGAKSGTPASTPAPATKPTHTTRTNGVLVIGLIGGIGAGKSEVARALGDEGFVVIDSDKEAKAALDRPEVRAQLVSWWGPEVLNDEGRVNRSAVAHIVFSSPEERARLEHLVHPLVKSSRAQLVQRAAQEGRAGVVIDAPLLLEAGSDAECDAVIFVDAPEPVRLDRVMRSRGWNAAELSRREKAQIPLEEKRRRADDTIVNDAGPDVLRARVRELLQRLHRKFLGRG